MLTLQERTADFRVGDSRHRQSWVYPLSLEGDAGETTTLDDGSTACEVAGAGDGATDSAKRARRGKPRTRPSERPTSHRASSRPYQATAPVPDPTGVEEVSAKSPRAPRNASIEQHSTAEAGAAGASNVRAVRKPLRRRRGFG